MAGRAREVSNLALAIALIAGISVNWQAIISLLGSWVFLASALTAIAAVVLGGLVGYASPETRTTTGLVSGLRFGSLGLIVIGTRLDGNADYLGPAIVSRFVDLILVLFLSVEIGRRAHSTPADAAAARAQPVQAVSEAAARKTLVPWGHASCRSETQSAQSLVASAGPGVDPRGPGAGRAQAARRLMASSCRRVQGGAHSPPKGTGVAAHAGYRPCMCRIRTLGLCAGAFRLRGVPSSESGPGAPRGPKCDNRKSDPRRADRAAARPASRCDRVGRWRLWNERVRWSPCLQSARG